MRKSRLWGSRVLVASLIASMTASNAFPAFADTGFVFEDEDDGITIENVDDEDEEDSSENGKTGTFADTKRRITANGTAGTNSELKKASDSELREASASEITEASASELGNSVFSLRRSTTVSSLGDVWDSWSGADFSFLDGNSGNGTESKPYQISNAAELMGLSQLAAMSMGIKDGSGIEPVGDYSGAYFELTSNINLDGMDWIPIGYYGDSAEFTGSVPHPFSGHFDGNGHTISNFKLSETSWPNVGFFGELNDAEITDLILKPNNTVRGTSSVGILAGKSVDSVIRNVTVEGSVEGSGSLGGVVGLVEGTDVSDSVIENVTADVTINVTGGDARYAGGIAGQAERSSIVDCHVETGDGTSRIQGSDASVGGIVGFQNASDIYNAYVTGTIGGSGSKRVGGIVGQYASGNLKVARFEGTIGQTGTGVAGNRGTFIGYRDAGSYYTFGEDESDDVAYLFADTESKISSNICGSGLTEDNAYTYDAHIGFSHSGDNFYTLVSGGNKQVSTETYYYEELEKGILSIIDEELGGVMDPEEVGYDIDHFAPNDAGKPIRGYLITIPQIDTVSGGTNYYDVAVLEAKGPGSYYKTLDKDNRGAVAPGKTVTVTTSPNNTDVAKYQMEGVPTYTKGSSRKETTPANGGSYTFTMPEENTEVTAVYKKVAVSVTTSPEVVKISVVEERTGNRKNPTKTTRVFNDSNELIATYINGELQIGTTVQPINVSATVDTNNDVEDSSVKWSIDDPDLITLLANDDADADGYTKKSASIQVNLNSAFIADTVAKLEKEQADSAYQNKIPSTVFGAGHQNGGIAVLTATTRPAASFEEKPCTSNSQIQVTFQIKDNTYVGNEGATLDKQTLEFVVTRKLTGNRKTPTETITVTAPQALDAAFNPDYFDKKDITWSVSDNALIAVDGDNKAASVSAFKDAKWIKDIISTDTGNHENDPYVVQTGKGTRTATVTVKGEDMLGHSESATCEVTIRFETVDETIVYVEGVEIAPSTLSYNLALTKTGRRTNPTLTWSGNVKKNIVTTVLPELAENKNYTYSVSDDSLTVAKDGTVTVNTGAAWIKKIDSTYPYSGNHTATITAITEDGGFKATVKVTFAYKLTDNTTSSSSGGSSGGGGGGGGGGGSSSGVTSSGGVGPASAAANAGTNTSTPGNTSAPAGSVTGLWVRTEDGLWAFTSGGRTYHTEWAYVHNPYAAAGQSATDWFRFDTTGHMVTGWYLDTDGNTYYLWPYGDNTQGHMVTGWHWIKGADGLERCYFFNTISDGTRGRLYKNETTPDGYQVNVNGEWIVNGVVQTRVPQA